MPLNRSDILAAEFAKVIDQSSRQWGNTYYVEVTDDSHKTSDGYLLAMFGTSEVVVIFRSSDTVSIGDTIQIRRMFNNPNSRWTYVGFGKASSAEDRYLPQPSFRDLVPMNSLGDMMYMDEVDGNLVVATLPISSLGSILQVSGFRPIWTTSIDIDTTNFIPENINNWDGSTSPENTSSAIDQLADRIKQLEILLSEL
jgi:hypothetical protein